MSRHCLLLSLCITAFVLSPLGVAGTRSAGGSSATLKNVAASLDKRTGLVTIEASAPVAYVAVQPDARTTIVEMRDVATTGFARDVKVDEHHPVDSVQVENATTSDGAAIARVRITFRQPIRPRIRSSRNLILVEADRVDGTAAVGPKLDADGSPPAIHDVRVTQRGTATAVTLRGKGPLMATSVQEPKEGPRRIVVNLGSVTSTVPGNTAVKGGPVERVRVGMSPTPPFDTQVTMELSRTAPYRLETSADGNDLSVVFDEPPADPIAALRTAATTPRPAAAAVVAAAPAPQLQAAQAQAPQQPVQAVPAQARPQFTGAPISIDFTDADLRGVLTLLGTENGLNLYIDPRVQGTVTVNAKEIPWDEAFDLIASSNGLGYVQRGSVVRVAPLAVLAEEEAARRKVEEERALSGELRTLTKTLSYGNAEDLAATVKATILSPRGDVQIDKRTNTVIITDLSDRLQRAADLLTTLDQPEQQVEIEARIVQTTRDFARSVGIQWGLSGRVAPDLGNTTPLTFPNQGSISGRTGAAQGPDAVGTAVDLGVTGATSAVGLSLGAINGALNLDVVLSALERSGKGKILSTPRVATQNNVEAEIMQGIQVPVPTIANNTVTVTFKDAALILRVLPQITAANTVIMRIVVENASPDFSREVNNIPPIDTQKATTSVRVGDGQTTVIGGVYISREQATQGRTPGLSNIPLLGYLFKRNTYSDESRELLIFITPRIIRL
jgi:type IV pilus secretin PilQ/predicted competence protein